LMMPPNAKRIALPGAIRDTSTHCTKSTRRPSREQSPRPFVVVVEAGKRRRVWDRYASLDAADAVVTKLRKHGLAATVEVRLS